MKAIQWLDTPDSLLELRAFLKPPEHFTGVDDWRGAATISDGQGLRLEIPLYGWLSRDQAGKLQIGSAPPEAERVPA
jgi:hypothetical protein